MSLKITTASLSRVENSFRQLATTAQALNTASEDLGKVIRQLDASLKKLGLGVTAWVSVNGTSDDVQYWTTELGYAKTDGKWGLSLREVTGSHLDSNDVSEQVWSYNEAPRQQRAEAVEKIPDLLEKLLQHAQDATRELKEKIEHATELTSLVSGLTPSILPAAPQQFQRLNLDPLPIEPPTRKPEQAATTGRFREIEAPLPVERPTAVARFREPEAAAATHTAATPSGS